MPGKRDESFSQNQRLRKSNDFRRVFTRGRRTANRFFVIYTLPNHLSFSRLGIQVRAKVATAVRRNAIKRMVREVFRKAKSDFVKPLDVVFIANKELLDLDYHSFEKEFRAALGRALR